MRATAAFASESSHGLQSLRLPGSGWPTATSRIGVDDDLVIGEVPAVLGRLGDAAVAGRDQGGLHDQDGARAQPPRC